MAETHHMEYSLRHEGNCILIKGHVPLTVFAKLAELAPKDSIVSPDTARIYDVTFAFGPANELHALRVAGEADAVRRVRAEFPSLDDLSIRWLAIGERGASSNALFSHLTGLDCTDKAAAKDSHPFDASDFRRCELLLESVPELRPRLHRMESLSPTWARLARAWPTIVDALNQECPRWRDAGRDSNCPQSYELIDRVISPGG